MTEYFYLGDKLTDLSLKNRSCYAVRRKDGKCIRGKNGNMLVEIDGIRVNIIGRRLRKNNKNEKAL